MTSNKSPRCMPQRSATGLQSSVRLSVLQPELLAPPDREVVPASVLQNAIFREPNTTTRPIHEPSPTAANGNYRLERWASSTEPRPHDEVFGGLRRQGLWRSTTASFSGLTPSNVASAIPFSIYVISHDWPLFINLSILSNESCALPT